MPKVIGIGEIVIDKMYYLGEFPQSGQKVQSSDSFSSLGGPVPAALKFLKNMGCETKLFGSIGDDAPGKYAQDLYRSYGIDTDLIIDAQTKVNTVLVDTNTGSRSIIKDSPKNKLLKNIPLEELYEADIVVFDRSEIDAFDFVIKNKKPHTKIVVDPSTEWSPKTIHMMKNSDACIFPIETVNQMSERYSVQYNLDLLYNTIGKTLIITDGPNGSYIYDGNERKIIQPLEVDAIDTNGAGDVFRGAFAWGMLEGWNLEKNVEFSNGVAGLHCCKKGNLTAIPTKEEVVNNLLQSHYEKPEYEPEKTYGGELHYGLCA